MGGFKTLGSVLFILFRSLKCNLRGGWSLASTTHVCLIISVMLIITWCLKKFKGQSRAMFRAVHQHGKIARMRISWRQAAEGLLLALMAGCGAFLLLS